uniref:Dynein regulatory complex subunit 2 n=1 Tax=Cacopsylla melanoneura TaxID=428564 RepID=A0A8D8QTE3_9HEMI
MGPKKKGGKDKLARMSSEDRLRYLQHRAAIEEESKRRRDQLVSTYLKNKLRHEELSAKINSAKINQQWRQCLRHLKNKGLKDDMLTLWQGFEVSLEVKDKVLQSLLGELDQAELQYARQFQYHHQVLEHLVGFHHKQMDIIRKRYIELRDSRLATGTTDLARLDTKSVEDSLHLRTINYDLNQRRVERERELAKQNEAQQDDVIGRSLAKIHRMTEAKRAELDSLNRSMTQIFRDYDAFTREKQTAYENLLETDAHYNELRVKGTLEEIQLLKTIQRLRSETLQGTGNLEVRDETKVEMTY